MESATLSNLEHSHHWVIAEANGPSSDGACKHCDAHRNFPNWLAEADFKGARELDAAAAGGNPWRQRG